MDTINTVYVKALSNGEWFGGWAPVEARLEWLREDKLVGLFTIVEDGLNEDDEYEFYQKSSLVIAVSDEDHFKAISGADVNSLIPKLAE